MISSIDTDVKVIYDIGNLIFEGQTIIVGLGASPFSGPADSGSLILEKTSNLAVGLLFAYTIANRIDDVLSELCVRLVL